MFANAKHRKRARQVLALGEIAAVSSHKVLMDSFPEVIGREGFATWNFFCTVAAVGSAMYQVSGPDVPQDRLLAVTKAVARALEKWDHQGRDAHVDLLRFVDRTIKGSSVSTQTAVGVWVMWSVKGAEPAEKEFEAGAALGALLFDMMAGAWA